VVTSSATVFLVRHGRTPLNAAGVVRGRIDTPLDYVGRHEARLLDCVFDGARLAAVVSSPLTRAVETAAAIAEAARLPVDVEDDLADRDYGRCAGTSQADAESEFGSLEAVPGIEALESFAPRVSGAVARAGDRAASGAVGVVAHDAVNRHVLASLVPSLGPAPGIPQRTGCWNELQRDGDQWSAPVVDAVPADGRRPRPRGRQR
jgi:broad specificity phosphatase PhoE